jgi:DNA-binding NarL/FixJ family response regulator
MAVIEKPLRVIILDDQLVQRQGIAQVVEDTGSMQVALTTDSPEQALQFLTKNSVDLALVDLVLHDQHGTVVGRAMRRLNPELPVIIYTHEKSMVLAADIFWAHKESGQPSLQGYLLTSSISNSHILRHVYDQLMVFGHFIDPVVLEWHYRLKEYESLTNREEECALCLAAGMSNAAISRELGITLHRVENIISTLYLKFRIFGDPGNPGRRVLLAEAIRLLYGNRLVEKRLSVLIVDDQAEQRARIRQSLAEDRRLNVIDEAGKGMAGLEAARQKHPDVVLLDVHLPDLNGFRVTRLILEELPQTRVILHTADPNPTYKREALQAGAIALLSKAEISGNLICFLCRSNALPAGHTG